VTDDKQRQYFLNFCGPLLQVRSENLFFFFFSSPSFHRKAQFPPNVTACSDSNETQVCQVWDSGAAGVSCGKTNRVSSEREFFRNLPSLTLHIRGGTPRFGVAAKSVVHLFCNGSGSDAEPSFSHEVVHDFEYHFAWRRAEVCAGPSPPPTTAPPPTTTSTRPPPTSSTTAANTTGGSDSTTGSTADGSSGSTEHSTKSHHSGHSSTGGNETLSDGTTSVNGTMTVATPGGPDTIDVRLIIVLAVLGALVVIALVVLVSVYLARRRKRLSGYSSLVQKQEPFERI
jgi:hypothetical protein